MRSCAKPEAGGHGGAGKPPVFQPVRWGTTACDLARALAQRTEALILDEPTNHLDIKYQLQLLNIVKSMHKTVLSAFHDLNLAAMYSDVIYVVKDGQIYSRGTPREVLTERMIEEVYACAPRSAPMKTGSF